MNLNDVYKIADKRKKRKRVGRGPGSGTGKTAGRGHKGQKSRSGYSMHRWYEGGQMPLFRRLPKRGFNNPWKQDYAIVNLALLEKHFENGEVVNLESLIDNGVLKIKKSEPLPLKVLGHGELTKKLTVEAHSLSKTARDRIEKAGGEIKTLKIQKDVTRDKMNNAKKESLKRKREKRAQKK